MIKLPERLAALSLLALTAACGGDGAASDLAARLATPQRIDLRPVGDNGVPAVLALTPTGQTTDEPRGTPTRLEAVLSADGLDPGFVYAAHLHEGTCGSDQGVVAQLVSLTPDLNGRATSSTALELAALSGPARLFAQIHGSGGEVVSCGDL